MSLTRRNFLAGAVGLAGVTLPQEKQAGTPAAAKTAPLPTRKLGRTGLEVPILTLGTHPLGTLPDEDDDQAIAIIARAIELGVRYLDTAPSYAKHRAERRIAAAIRGRREKLLLGTKSYLLPKDKALAELDESLRALETDHVDIFQIHAVGDHEDRKRKLDADDGILAAALAARKAGKCRFIGVTGHRNPEVMAACLESFEFDTLLVPVNCADPLWLSFVKDTLPVAKRRGTAVIAMKVFAAGKLVAGVDDVAARAAACLRYTLSQDIATASVGAKSLAELEADVQAARSFAEPMSAEEQTALTARYAPHPGNPLEWYKGKA